MIIAVWGNNGSGKSTFAIKLANSFARLKKNVVLIDADYVAPQLNVWYPKLNIKPEQSLSVLLDNNIDSVETIVSKIQVINENLGVLGYAKDFSSNIIPRRSEPAEELLRLLPELCDVTIVDCRSDVTNDILSFATLAEFADERIVAITPDVKGVSWYDSNVRMFEENWTNNSMSILKIFNKARMIAPVADIEKAIGSVEYYLPHDTYIERELFAGTMGGEDSRKNARQYTHVVDAIATELLSKHTTKQ